jgi:hypothetical protein
LKLKRANFSTNPVKSRDGANVDNVDKPHGPNEKHGKFRDCGEMERKRNPHFKCL